MDGKVNIMLALGTAAILTGAVSCGRPADGEVVVVEDERVSLASLGTLSQNSGTLESDAEAAEAAGRNAAADKKDEADEGQSYGSGNFSFMLDSEWKLVEEGNFYYTFCPGESIESADAYLGIDYEEGAQMESILQIHQDQLAEEEEEQQVLDGEYQYPEVQDILEETAEEDWISQDAWALYLPPAWSQVFVGTGNYPAVMVEYQFTPDDGEELPVDCQAVYYIQDRDGIIELTLAARKDSVRMEQLDEMLGILTLYAPAENAEEASSVQE